MINAGAPIDAAKKIRVQGAFGRDAAPDGACMLSVGFEVIGVDGRVAKIGRWYQGSTK
jgi:hypothetical protein